ncbi:HHR146Wp [Eremothecium sinecaudum]|uniref:HHR146Wp n=1 Tax=Eremothecium sinecaudum TaxID=45286 RepID=A0A0X8HWT9_9SACH|nr:HHR146Wp [Eremothecium sinecaudum]AMD22915.1 HHR146Wp [Eremothecium sinecaudum]
MAVIEKLYRRIVDMGLVPKIIASLPRISMLCALLGVVWLTVFIPMEGQYRRTYISENALMPSQAYSYFRESEWNILRGYRKELEAIQQLPVHERNLQVSTWMENYGAKTAIYEDSEYGETLYGILHSPRGDGTEAMVLAAPWTTVDGLYNNGGVGLSIALARFFSRWPVWSKNIIIVLSEDPGASLKAWLQAYHGTLDFTGGSIESAIVLDYPGESNYFQYMEVSYHGLNGAVPNLDLVNIAVHIIEHEGMKASLHGIPIEEMGDNTFKSRLKVMLLGIRDMALSGVKKTTGHEVFSGWRIQSITLRAHGNNGQFDVTTFGRVPEAIFRSVNNLLEKFHQSFFFYLMLAPRYFVSIGSYLPSAIAFSVSFAIASLDCILNNEYSSLPMLSIYNIWAVLAFAIALLISFLTSQAFAKLPLPALLLLFNLGLSTVSMTVRSYKIKKPFSYRFKSFAYLYFSLVLNSLLVVNFALAFAIGILAFPMTLVKTTSNGVLRERLRNSMLLLISNPFIATWIYVHIFESQLQGMSVFYSLVDAWHKLGCWTWYVLCIGWYPAWILVAYSSIDSTPVVTENKKSL